MLLSLTAVMHMLSQATSWPAKLPVEKWEDQIEGNKVEMQVLRLLSLCQTGQPGRPIKASEDVQAKK